MLSSKRVVTHIGLKNVEALGDVRVGGVFLDGLVEVVHYRGLQVLLLHVACDADGQLSHEDDQQEYWELEWRKQID